jgi:hypothetical protein
MTGRTVVLFSVAAAGMAGQRAVHPIQLSDLTVPTDQVDSRCAFPAAPTLRVDAHLMRGGLWANLPIPTNPWAGTDPYVIASIRERVNPPVVPDAPPMTSREAARFRILLAEGIEEAYAAVYVQSELDPLVVVYGLRFKKKQEAIDFWRATRPTIDPRSVGIAMDQLVILVTGDGGYCFQKVAAHVRTISALR